MAKNKRHGMGLYIPLSTVPTVPLCWIGMIAIMLALLLILTFSEELFKKGGKNGK